MLTKRVTLTHAGGGQSETRLVLPGMKVADLIGDDLEGFRAFSPAEGRFLSGQDDVFPLVNDGDTIELSAKAEAGFVLPRLAAFS